MAFIRRHWRGILLSGLLLIALVFSGLAFWAAGEIASPPRRPLMAYHQELLDAAAQHGMVLRPFSVHGEIPSILCEPDPSGMLGTRGLPLRNGLTARGIALAPPGRIIGTLVLVHGRRGRKEDYLPIAERLCAVGFRCLLFDLPAHGDHPQTVVTYGFRESILPTQVLAAAAGQFGFDPTPAGIFGISMGGSVAVHACAQPQAPWKALVVIASFDSLPQLLREKATSRAGQPLGNAWFDLTDFFYRRKTGLSTNAVRPMLLAPSLRLPTLVAHGADDRVIPIENGHRLFQAFPDSSAKQWIEVPDAGHDNILVTDFPIYAAIADWFLQHVPTTASPGGPSF